MSFKFEKLKIWQLSLDYIDQIYMVVSKLPDSEKFNLSSQLRRAATSIALNIAEGSTGQTNAEQARFLSIALRSLIETVACIKIIDRNKYVSRSELLKIENFAESLAIKIQAMRKSLLQKGNNANEEIGIYNNLQDEFIT